MEEKNFKRLVLLLIFCLPFCVIFSQEKKDTIYFDEDWSICEKPVAEYYRICELNRDNQIFYKGSVEDFYINGKLEMKGNYSSSGLKDGEFTFYNTNGLITKKGRFENDEMSGDWFYYNTTGNLQAVFNCESATTFTPVVIINNKGDTLLKNGKGKFIFNSQKDLPHVFSAAEDYKVEGEVIDNKKNGVFNYYTFLPEQRLIFSETYKNGKFIKSTEYNIAFGTHVINTPIQVLNLTDENLGKVDRFYHSNFVFGFGNEGDEKVVNFLLSNKFPEIKVQAINFFDNDRLLFDIIGKVIRSALSPPENTHVSYSFPSRNPFTVYYDFDLSKNENYIPRLVKGNIGLTIDTSGYIVNSTFATNLTHNEINKINYYLLHISNLSPFENKNQKELNNINLTLNTITDTLNDDTVNYKYIIYNSDSVNEYALKDYMEPESAAIFPGGGNSWINYIQRNLNQMVLVQHNAPNGVYVVDLSFDIDTYGNIINIDIKHDPGYGAAGEAIRVIKHSPQWQPAVRNGKPVIYHENQKITFTIN